MTEWIVILVIVLIFFGAGKLPEVFAQAGKGLKAFKDASEGRDEDEKAAASKKGEGRKQIARDPDDLDEGNDGDEDDDEEDGPPRRRKARVRSE